MRRADQGPAEQTILLIRVNSSTELLNTSGAVDQVRRAFPQGRLVTLATPQTETRLLLETDRRFGQVLLFPPEGDEVGKSVGAFRRFMRGRKIAATVVCFGATTGFDYSRHLLSALLCPGRRHFLDGKGSLFPVASAHGAGVLLRAILAQSAQKLLMPALRALTTRGAGRTRARLDREAVRRILVIRLDHLGDIMMSLPTVQALKAHFPSAQIDMLVGSAVVPILQDVPAIAEVFACDAPRFARSRRRQGRRERLALTRRLRRSHYDLALDLRGDDTSRLWTVASGAKRRAGPASGPYEPPNQANLSFLLTDPIPAGTAFAGLHTVEAGLALVRHLGVCTPDTPFRFPVTAERERAVTRKLVEARVADAYATIHVRPGNVAKRWDAASFAAVADHLVEKHRLDVLLSGAPEDSEANGQVWSLVRNQARVHNAAGVFALEELPALYRRARLMVTVDTGPMHIAAAVGTPIVALFLPWSASAFHPHGQQDGLVTPTPEGLKNVEQGGKLWEGSLLEAISARDVCDAVDRKLMAAHD